MSVLQEAEELTQAEAAAALQRCEDTIRKWVRTGRLPARRVNGRVLVKRLDVERLLAGEPVQPRAEGE